jgi:hypothetical protein
MALADKDGWRGRETKGRGPGIDALYALLAITCKADNDRYREFTPALLQIAAARAGPTVAHLGTVTGDLILARVWALKVHPVGSGLTK